MSHLKPLDWKVLYWGVLYSPCCLWWWPGLVFIAHLGVDSPGPWKAGKKRVGEGWSMLGEEARHNGPLTVGCWGSWTGGLGCCWPLWKQSGSFYWSWLDFTYSVVQSLSHVLLFASPWTAAHQAPPSMGFSRQEYWSGLPNTLENLVKIHSLLWSQTWWIIYSSCGVRNLWAFLLILMHIQVWEPLK